MSRAGAKADYRHIAKTGGLSRILLMSQSGVAARHSTSRWHPPLANTQDLVSIGLVVVVGVPVSQVHIPRVRRIVGVRRGGPK